ncbi:MAG: epoxyqueuosine reductase QueH, partial [bacterium]|nr:epoxyqueuosine reductase QueH [bacterium]
EQVAREVGVPFFYQDFRLGYREGYELSKEHDLYRQSYCGCVFSEYERYAGKETARRGGESGDLNQEG